MAYLEPETLTCPSCGKVADLKWVIGVGPYTKPGEGPAYVDVVEAGDWIVKTKDSRPKWVGIITCPICETIVKSAP